MRILHTADWHLGHTLHELDRGYEHDRFVEWLLDALGPEEQNIDALLICGDVFETANPSANAQRAWFRFLAEAKSRHPKLDIVVIAGNHDSAARLEAPRDLLDTLGVTVVGRIPRSDDGSIETDGLIVPLTDAQGDVAALCGAVPFLRATDLPRLDGTEDPLVAGVGGLYAEVTEALIDRGEPGQGLVVTGHCYMVGCALSELSERKILGGNLHALPVDLFSERLAYVALGHLHRAQRVGERDHTRYSGSPIPLSLTEASYQHQVCVVELEGEVCTAVSPLVVPRSVDMIRIPETGPASVDEVLALLGELPDLADDQPREDRPLLEVRVQLEAPDVTLRQRVAEMLASKSARLIKLTVEHTGTGSGLAEALPEKTLDDVDPEEVFRQRYSRDFADDPSPELVACFHEIREQVEAEEPS